MRSVVKEVEDISGANAGRRVEDQRTTEGKVTR